MAGLLIVDVQRDFCAGGPLAVPHADAIVPAINTLRDAHAWACVAVTQDWHPRGHVSFASSHPPEARPFSTVALPGGGAQALWPPHCVQGTPGAELHALLRTHPRDVVVRKGATPGLDAYSAFDGDALVVDGGARTPLRDALRARGVAHVFVCGLALDVCVAATARDARAAGLAVTLVLPACAGLDAGGVARELTALRALGVRTLGAAAAPAAAAPPPAEEELAALVAREVADVSRLAAAADPAR